MGGSRKQACSACSVHLCLPLLNISDSNTKRRDAGEGSDSSTKKRDAGEGSDGTGSSIQPGASHTIDLASMASRVASLSHGLSLAISPLRTLPGQTVMLAAINSSAMLEVLLAICDTGAIATPINYRWGPAELAAAMQLTQPIAIVVDAACRVLVQQALAQQSQEAQAALQPWVILMGAGADAGSVQTPGGSAGQPSWNCNCHRGKSNSCPSEVPLTEGQIPESGCSSRRETCGSGMQCCYPPEVQLSTEGLIRAGRCALDSSSRGGREAEADLQQTDACGGGTVTAYWEGQHMHCPLQLKAPADGAAIICFTSGTTGQPKGVVLTHAALHAQSLAKLATINYTATDTYLHLAPLFHVGGLSSAHAALMAGCTQVVLPRFDATSALQVMRSQRVTAFIAVPAMMQDLTKHARSSTASTYPPNTTTDSANVRPIPSVRKILMGAGATSPKLLADMALLFPCARIMSAYGMTETASSITFITLRQPHCSNSGHPHNSAASPMLRHGPPLQPHSSNSGCPHNPTVPPMPHHGPPLQPHCSNSGCPHNPAAPPTLHHGPPLQPHCSNSGCPHNPAAPPMAHHGPPLQPHCFNSGCPHNPAAPTMPHHGPPLQPHSSNSGCPPMPHHDPPMQPHCSKTGHLYHPTVLPVQLHCSNAARLGTPMQPLHPRHRHHHTRNRSLVAKGHDWQHFHDSMLSTGAPLWNCHPPPPPTSTPTLFSQQQQQQQQEQDMCTVEEAGAESHCGTGAAQVDLGARDRQNRPPGAPIGPSHPSSSGAVCVGWPGPGIKVHIQPQEGEPNGGRRGVPAKEGEPNGGQRGDSATGAGVLGEVCVQGACVMAGYWQAPEETEKTFLRGEQGVWLRTGDLGFWDIRGALWLHGRAKDMIKSGGENVHAAEVEAALSQHPGVAAAAVFGVPDTRMGEVVAAAVVLQPGWDWKGLIMGQKAGSVAPPPLHRQGRGSTASQQSQGEGHQQRVLSADQLRVFCRTGALQHLDGTRLEGAAQRSIQGLLSPYKLPRLIAATWPLGSPLPCNSSGKVLKLQVREAMLAIVGAQAQQERHRLKPVWMDGKQSKL